MTLDLLGLLDRFDSLADRETEDAFYRTHLPHVGSAAYLNIVYKAASSTVVEELGTDLSFPPPLSEFYRSWNGARLFVGALSVYGCLPRGQLLYRADPTRLLPFDIREANEEFAGKIIDRDLLCVGSYSYDRSMVCLSRQSQTVVCHFGTDFDRVRQEWPSLTGWLTEEVSRLSLLFDERGNRLVDKAHLLPGPESTRVV